MRLHHWLLAASLIAGQASAQLTITWGEDDANPRTFDPRVTQSRHESQLIVQVFDTLIGSDENNKLYPGLAKSWTVAPDGMSVTLQLRDDVTFHDGTKFNAQAVKFTFDTIVDPQVASRAAVDIIGPYAGCDVLSEYEVRVRYSRPFAPALASYSQNELSIVSPSAVQRMGNADFAMAPVGAGPFRFASWDRGQRVVLERFDAYNWAPGFTAHKGPSRVQRVVHRFIPDAATRVAALERGEIDIADLVPVLDLRRLGSDRRYKTAIGNATGLPFGLLLNTNRGPFADLRVRQAFAMGIDRKLLSDDLFFGLIAPAFGTLSTTTLGYWPGVEKINQYDPKRAAELLDEAGWKMGPNGIRVKDGQTLSIDYQVPPPMEPEVAVAIQAELKRIGFDVRVENMTFARANQMIQDNTYDAQPLRWISADPSLMEIMFHSRNMPRSDLFKFNWARVSDPALDALLEKGTTVVDPDARNAVYAEIQKRVMEGAYWFPINNQVQTVAWRAEHSGYRFARAQWIMRFYEVE